FFFIHTMQRDWKVFDLLRVNMPTKLPVVLSRDEVRALLGTVRNPMRRAALTTIYALGLRIGEGLRLETGDIDSARMTVWVRDGQRREGPWHSAAPTVAPSPPTVLEDQPPAFDDHVPVRIAPRARAPRRNHAAENDHRRAQRHPPRKTCHRPHPAAQ